MCLAAIALVLLCASVALAANEQIDGLKVRSLYWNTAKDCPRNADNQFTNDGTTTTALDVCTKFSGFYLKTQCIKAPCNGGYDWNIKQARYTDDQCTKGENSVEWHAHYRCYNDANGGSLFMICDDDGVRTSNNWGCCSPERERCVDYKFHWQCEADRNCKWCNNTLKSQFPYAQPFCQSNYQCVDRSNLTTTGTMGYTGGDCWQRDAMVARQECEARSPNTCEAQGPTFNDRNAKCKSCSESSGDASVTKCSYSPPWGPINMPLSMTSYASYDRDQCPVTQKNAASSAAPALTLAALVAAAGVVLAL